VREVRHHHPTALVELKAMTGESGDNVPGVKGIGDVRALALLTAHNDLEGVIAAGLRNACKHSTMVADDAVLARLSRRLVTLATDVPSLKSHQRVRAVSLPSPAR